MAPSLRTRWTGFRIQAGEKYFLPSPKHPDRLWGITSLLLTGTGVLSRWYSDRGVMFTIHLRLALRLRTSRAMPLLLLHAFMVWTGAALTF
jgi:hypothetical protein